MNARDAIHYIDSFLGDEVLTTEIQILSDGWHVIQHVPSDVMEARTVFLGDREMTINVPIYNRETIVHAQTLKDVARHVIELKTGDSLEEYIAKRVAREERDAPFSSPITQDVLVTNIVLEDYLVPYDYQLNDAEAAYRIKCVNCKGAGKFLDLNCYLCAEDKHDDCTNCNGSGKYDNACPICNGETDLPAIMIARFINETNDTKLAIRIGGPYLPDFSVYTRQGYGAKPNERSELRVDIELDVLFNQICKKLGVSSKTHSSTYLGEISTRAWAGPLRRIFVDHISVKPDEEPDLSDDRLAHWKELAQQAFAQRTSHYLTDEYILEQALQLGLEPNVWGFVKTKELEEVLDEISQRAFKRGYAIAIVTRFYETGAHPLAIDLIDADGFTHYSQLGHDYSLDVTALQALNSIDDALDIADTNRE